MHTGGSRMQHTRARVQARLALAPHAHSPAPSACLPPQGYRYAMPHSILMMHHPSGTSRGQASEMHIESRELVRVRDYLSLVTSEATGQPYDRVIRELSRNKWMDPKEAVEYGMIDKVLTTPMPKMPMGPAFKYQAEPGTSGVPGF